MLRANWGDDGRLDEGLEKRKIRINAGAGLRGNLDRWFRPGLRRPDPGFATTQRRSSFQTNAYADSDAASNSACQPAGDYHTSGDADPNAATHAPSNRRANSD